MQYTSKFSGEEIDSILDNVGGKQDAIPDLETIRSNAKNASDTIARMVESGYLFAGIATIDANPGVPDAKVFYIANGKGTYTNFGGLEVTEDEVVVLYWDTAWHKVSTGIASQAKLSELEEKVDEIDGESVSFTDSVETGVTYNNTQVPIHLKGGRKYRTILSSVAIKNNPFTLILWHSDGTSERNNYNPNTEFELTPTDDIVRATIYMGSSIIIADGVFSMTFIYDGKIKEVSNRVDGFVDDVYLGELSIEPSDSANNKSIAVTLNAGDLVKVEVISVSANAIVRLLFGGDYITLFKTSSPITRYIVIPFNTASVNVYQSLKSGVNVRFTKVTNAYNIMSHPEQFDILDVSYYSPETFRTNDFDWESGSYSRTDNIIIKIPDTTKLRLRLPISVQNPSLQVSVNEGWEYSLTWFKGGKYVDAVNWSASPFSRSIYGDTLYVLIRKVGNPTISVDDFASSGISVVVTSKYLGVPMMAESLTNYDSEYIEPIRQQVIEESKRVNTHDLHYLFNGRYIAHLFIENIYSSSSPTIPSQSLFDIDVARRLGFKAIELNVHRTSDNEYYCFHGIGDNFFGGEFYSLDGVDTDTLDITSVTNAYVRENIRYRSSIDKYKVAPSTFRDTLLACRTAGMIPLIQNRDEKTREIADNVMGRGNYLLGIYGGNRPDGVVCPCIGWNNLTTKQAIIDKANASKYGYFYGMSNPTAFTDVELKDIIEELHRRGFGFNFAAGYAGEFQSQRLFSLSADCCASQWSIPEIVNGNIINASSDVSFVDFNHNGTDNNGVLNLAPNQIISPKVTSSEWLSGGSLHILFTGKLHFKFGAFIDADFESDGSREMWFSTYFLNAIPTFEIKAVTNSQIIQIGYKASKM